MTKLILFLLYFVNTIVLANPLFSMTVGEPGSAVTEVKLRTDWLNRNFDMIMASGSPSNWNAPYNIDWQLRPWQQHIQSEKSKNLHYTAYMLAAGETLEQCASGQLDYRWIPLGQSLMKYGFSKAIIRIGHEMTGNWYAWSAIKKENLFVSCYRRIVSTLRKSQPSASWKFEWNPIPSTNLTTLIAVYPGDSYVDYISTDIYDTTYTGQTYPYPTNCFEACRLERQKRNWSAIKTNLDRIKNFALGRKKPFALTEWGVWDEHFKYGAGGDNPYFIEQMYKYINDKANNIAYHSYFEIASDGDHRLYSSAGKPTAFVKSAQKFKDLFGLKISLNSFSITDLKPSAGQSFVMSASLTANNNTDSVYTTLYFTNLVGQVLGSVRFNSAYKGYEAQQFKSDGYILPATLPIGLYNISISVHSLNYKKLLFFKGNIAQFEVLDLFKLKNLSFSSSLKDNVLVNNLSLQLIANLNLSDVLINIYYTDPLGKPVASKVISASLLKLQDIKLSWLAHKILNTQIKGRYYYSLSIYNKQWTKLYYYKNNVAYFEIK